MTGNRLLLAALLALPLLAAGAEETPAEGRSAYLCTSRLGGVVPQGGPFYHASVASCPDGVSPTVRRGWTNFNNPACTFYGTHPGTRRFQVESERRGVSCRPAKLPAEVVERRVASWDEEYKLFGKNCQDSAHWATGFTRGSAAPRTGPAADGSCGAAVAGQAPAARPHTGGAPNGAAGGGKVTPHPAPKR